ncbi:tyrosine-type recombinase/integrase [Clostridium sp. SHJSY1]|uniref:tyrosine-type recombinase/integrase n=1 Tax=Clostridium sp. SHJSY1 TaxID=2942483 RepID=UPI002876FA14|nr:tyrosine-type recombinase/integrase [Clostridium sp. SHJSY1]MDS0527827.1 tyrosine-type recombinase/integrase [Clostridium sp. SHJSY1]
MKVLDEFIEYLKNEEKSFNTIKGYVADLKDYFKWFQESFSKDFKILLRQNVLEYKSYLQNVRRNNAKTINHKLSSLLKYNQYLVSKHIQDDIVIDPRDKIKIQLEYASPTKVTETEVKQFLQTVLESRNTRNYALMVLLAYTGIRISEALNIRMDDFDLNGKECIIRSGKGDKQRSVILNGKVINALKEYLKNRENLSSAKESMYLFVSKKNKKLDRTTVNRIFQKYSDKITPHQLRHFFCTNALEKGMLTHEVANQAGHSNIHTTLLYTNPDKKKLIKKMENL